MNESNKERWSELETKRFVSSYLKKTILWDRKHPTFRNQVRKKAAYKMLMKEFEFSSITEVKIKMRSIGATFNQAVKKSQQKQNYVPKLCWFAEMDHAFNRKRRAKTATVKQDVIEHSSVKEIVSTIVLPVDDQTEVTVNSDPKNDNNIEPNEEQYGIYDLDGETFVKELESNAESTKLFLKSLRGIFERLTYKQNLQARIKIQEVLYNIMNNN